jgi:apolipoprotein D and lipocalin family protein
VFPDGDFNEICGYAVSKDPNNLGQLALQFPGTPEGDYWVLDTDYENYSAVYSCGTLFGLVKLEYAFVLTRDANPSEEIVSHLQIH